MYLNTSYSLTKHQEHSIYLRDRRTFRLFRDLRLFRDFRAFRDFLLFLAFLDFLDFRAFRLFLAAFFLPFLDLRAFRAFLDRLAFRRRLASGVGATSSSSSISWATISSRVILKG